MPQAATDAPATPPTRRRARPARRGATSILALLFLILFAALAVGFYASTTMSVQVAKNDRDTGAAQRAAESGMKFLRLQLNHLSIPPGTATADVAAEVEADLKAFMDGTENLAGRTVTRSGDTVTVPPIDLGDGSSFSATLTWADPNLTVTVTGSAAPSAAGAGAAALMRGIEVDYRRVVNVADSIPPPPQTNVLDYGVAARGPVVLKNSVETKITATPASDGGILSASTASPSITTGNGSIAGDLGVVTADSQVTLGGGTIGGASGAARADHVHVVPPPSFPTVNTDPFKALAVNVYASGVRTQNNIRVPPNTNPRFNGGDVINGILYIESPNQVNFQGNATVNGIIVFENKGTSAQNTLDFKGTINSQNMPNTAEFAGVRAASPGLSILAPTAAVTMSGSADATVRGSLFAYSVDMNGSADLNFELGTVVSLGPAAATIQGKTVNFAGTGSDNPPVVGVTLPPPGVTTYNSHFLAQPTSYREVTP